MTRLMYLTPREKDILLQFAHQTRTSLSQLLSSQLDAVTAEGMRSTTDVLIGLIEKGLVESDYTHIFGLTSRGMDVVGHLLAEETVHRSS